MNVEKMCVSIRESKFSRKLQKDVYGKYKILCHCGFVGEAKDKYFCPECNSKASIKMEKPEEFQQIRVKKSEYKKGRVWLKFISTIRLFEKQNKIFDKLSYTVRDLRISIEYNMESGELRGNFCGMTGDYTSHHFSYCFSYANHKDEYFLHLYKKCKNFKNFILDVAEKKDIKERFINVLLKEKRFSDFFSVVYYPALQYSPWKYMYTDSHNKVFLSKLSTEKNYSEICQTLFGHHSKKFRALALDGNKHDFLLNFAPYIKDVDYLLEFANHVDRVLTNDTLMMKYPYTDICLSIGVELLTSLYESKTWMEQLKKNHMHYKRVSMHGLCGYVADIGRMISDIKLKKPDYEVKKMRYIKDLHDNLSRDRSRLEHENIKISYEKEECALEKTFEDCCIKLAKNTHELVDIGRLLQICVGSYANAAISKSCTILTLQENKKPVVCIELRGNKLNQAKMHRNYRPNEKYKQLIIDWAKENEINYHNCYDLT